MLGVEHTVFLSEFPPQVLLGAPLLTFRCVAARSQLPPACTLQ